MHVFGQQQLDTKPGFASAGLTRSGKQFGNVGTCASGLSCILTWKSNDGGTPSSSFWNSTSGLTDTICRIRSHNLYNSICERSSPGRAGTPVE
eukprot:352421-Chlamydomonas_euryale.AAC.25